MESRQAIRAITIPHSNQFLILRLSRGDGRVAHRLRTADLKKPPPEAQAPGGGFLCRAGIYHVDDRDVEHARTG